MLHFKQVLPNRLLTNPLFMFLEKRLFITLREPCQNVLLPCLFVCITIWY